MAIIDYEYDANGNLTRKIDPRLVPNTSTRRAITYVYDDLGRVTTRTYNDGTPNVSYSYDATNVAFSKGRLTTVSSSVSSYSYGEYDPLGRVKTGTQTTDGQAYTMSYAYNRAGAIISQTYPSGRIVTTDYDGAGRIAGVKNNSGTYYAGAASIDATNRLQYSAAGAIEAMKLGALDFLLKPLELPQLRELIRLGGDAIEGPWDGEEAITLLADLDAGCTVAMTGGAYPDGIRTIVDAYAAGDREAAVAAYAKWLPLINYENRQGGILTAKALM